MPENAPPGQLPRSVDVILYDDLVDKVKPGDRVRIYGVYRSLGGTTTGSTTAIFRYDLPDFWFRNACSLRAIRNSRTIVLANHVYLHSKDINQRPISDIDIQNIKKIGKRKNVVDLLAGSLAPSIYGNDYQKKGILLMLLSGMEKNLSNGTHLRG
jgi:DNA replication licensing factor MCM3